MADRVSPSLQPASRGRYQVFVRGGSAAPGLPIVSTNSARAITSSGSLELPKVRSVTGKGFKFSSGGETFAAMRDVRAAGVSAGLQRDAVPVQMTMAQARAAAKKGLLAGGGGGMRGNDRLALAPSMLVVSVDLTDMRRLGDTITNMGLVIRKGHGVIAKAINEGIRRFETGVRRDLVQWTGIKDRARVGRGFSRTFASAATLTGRIRVRDRHIRLTAEYFGAKWNRADPGGTHAAWKRPQLARHSFMIPGAKPLFKRVERDRKPIAPLWGPNVVREIERHEGEVRGRLAVVQIGVQQTAVRLMRMAIARGR